MRIDPRAVVGGGPYKEWTFLSYFGACTRQNEQEKNGDNRKTEHPVLSIHKLLPVIRTRQMLVTEPLFCEPCLEHRPTIMPNPEHWLVLLFISSALIQAMADPRKAHKPCPCSSRPRLSPAPVACEYYNQRKIRCDMTLEVPCTNCDLDRIHCVSVCLKQPRNHRGNFEGREWDGPAHLAYGLTPGGVPSALTKVPNLKVYWLSLVN
jgi:hypothetical protein